MVDPKAPAAAAPQAPAPASSAPQATPPAAPVAPAATPPASQKPPATPSGAPQTPPASTPEDKDKTVPITALHEEREKRQQLQAQVEALKRIMSNNVLFDAQGNPVAQQQQQQQPVQQQQYQQEIEKLWETDPRRAVHAEIYAAMMWRDQVDAAVEQQAADVATKNADFNNYRPEVMAYLRTLPFDQRNKQGMVEAAYYFIRGQKVDNIIAKQRQEFEQEYIRKMQAGEFAQQMPNGAFSAPPSPQGTITLTEDQKKAAAAMRMPESEYAKYVVNR
jgi:hypothetical protein